MKNIAIYDNSGYKWPPNPILRIGLSEHPESPFSNVDMRRHACSSAPSGCQRLARGLPRFYRHLQYLPWGDWMSYPLKTVLGNYENLLIAMGLDEEKQQIEIESLIQSVKIRPWGQVSHATSDDR